jgi:hypothetical protein
MKAFLKDNIAIVAAIVLPLILAVIFAISTLVTNVSVEDPQYDLLVATDYYAGSAKFEFNTDNDKITVIYHPDTKDANGYNMTRNMPKLWRIHVQERKVEQISLAEPADKKQGNVKIPALEGLKVQNIQPGPDGYSYENYYRYRNNFMSEIFAGDTSARHAIALEKDGRLVKIKVPDSNWGYNAQFIGWIIE